MGSLRKLILLSIAGCLVQACTKGDPARQTTSNGDSPAFAQRTSGQRLTCSAYLIAPIASAHVTVTRLKRGADELIAETTTDDKGQCDVILPQTTDGDLLIQVVGDRGGGTLEPVTGIAPITLSESDKLMALAVDTQLGQETFVAINPLSTLVAARALAEYRAGATLSAAFAKNVDLFSAHFQTASPWQAPPVDVTLGEAPGLSSSVIYGLITVGLSQHALELGARAGVTDVSIVNSLVVLRALVADLDDGVFTGTKAQDALKIVGNVYIDQETTRLALAKSIDAWLDSDKNKTGLTKRDVSQLTNAIRQDVSELYPPAIPPEQKPDTSQSGAPPLIVVLSPKPDQTLGVNDTVVGYIEDADGLSTFKLMIDGKQVVVPIDTSSSTKWTFTFDPDLDDGSHVLQVEAGDIKGNRSSAQVTFAFDSTGPSVSLVQCPTPDDRSRPATVSTSGVTYSDTTIAGPCTEGDLTVGTQQFYTYADLYEEGTRIPQILLSVTDLGTLSAVTYTVKLNDVVAYGPEPLAKAKSPSTHVLAIGQEVLGLPSLGVHAADDVKVEIKAVDSVGNETVRTFWFHLTLIPTPLYVQQTTVDSSVSLSAHTFAANNVQNLFAQTISQSNVAVCGSWACQAFPESLIYVTKFMVVNVSPRPVVMSTDWATATQGSMSMKRTAFRSLVPETNALALGATPCPEITEVDDYPDWVQCGYGFCPGQPSYSNQTCLSLNGDFKRGRNSEHLQFTPTVAVYQQPGNVRVTQTPFTMAPGAQYTVVIAMFNMRVQDFPTQLANTQYPPRDKGGSFGGGGYATSGNSFYDVDYFQSQDNGGFLGVRGLIYNYNTQLFSYFRGFIGTNTWYPGYGQSGNARTHLIRVGSSNFAFRPVVFEHSVEFTSTVRWRVPIAMSATDPAFVGTGDHLPMNSLTSFQTASAKPALCPYTNPLCTVDLTGW